MSSPDAPKTQHASAPGAAEHRRRPVRTVVTHQVDLDNPYQRLFYNALEKYGYVWNTHARQGNWRLPAVCDGDVLHIHWGIQDICHGPTRFTSLRMVLRLALDLLQLRRRGKKIVWTCHNLKPHEPGYALTDWLARFVTAQAAHVVLTHSRWAAGRVRRRFFRRRRLLAVPFGSYSDAYGRAPSRTAARAALGLAPEARVFLFQGAIRHYKGVPALIEVFREVGARDEALLIAGRVGDAGLESEIQRAAHDDPRMRCALGFTPKEALLQHVAAADFMILPFRRITTSSSAVLALSYGLAVIAPDFPFLQELLGEDYPLLYRHDRSDGLRDAPCRARDVPRAALHPYHEAARRRLSWDEPAHALAEALRELFEQEERRT
jgi:glycosyltransferase involved in cell wall biosynthesis